MRKRKWPSFSGTGFSVCGMGKEFYEQYPTAQSFNRDNVLGSLKHTVF